MSLALVLVSIFAVWRATHLLHAEDGPWKLAVKLRNTLRERRSSEVLLNASIA